MQVGRQLRRSEAVRLEDDRLVTAGVGLARGLYGGERVMGAGRPRAADRVGAEVTVHVDRVFDA